jgi:C_GCAxxG_C_C family probable redox protein
MTKSDDALASFRSGFTCSSAVFSTFSAELGLDTEAAKKISCGFGAGISKTGNICGAVSGAIMVIGLKFGKTKEGDDARLKKPGRSSGNSCRNLLNAMVRSTAQNCSAITLANRRSMRRHGTADCS